MRWDSIEALRKAIVLVVQGEAWIDLETSEGANELAEAIERCKTKVADEVGTGCALVPSGARAVVGQEPRPSVEEERAEVAKLVRNSSYDAVRVYMRPLGTRRAPLLDEMGAILMGDAPVADIAAGKQLSIEKLLDHLLLVLWDGLFLAQSDEWTQRGSANCVSTRRPRSPGGS